MSSDSHSDSTKHSAPIPINTSGRYARGRSASVSSVSSGSASSYSDVTTPVSTSASSARFGPVPVSPGSSPIFSYFFNQSPTKSPPGALNATYPFRKFGPPPVFEEDEQEPPVATHARRASTAVAGRFTQPQLAMPEPTTERGSGLLRRLSLSSGFARSTDMRSRSPPNAPPNSAVSPSEQIHLPPFAHDGKPRRSATISIDAKPRRAPSPMGERILKGHFDGFN